MIPKIAIVVAALTAAGTPAAVLIYDGGGQPATVVSHQANSGRPILRDPDGDRVNVRSCPWASSVSADENTWRIDCKILATVPNGTSASMVCWRDEEPPWVGASPRWFQVRDVDGVSNPDPPVRLWVWADYVDNQTPHTPRCKDVGRENEAPPKVPERPRVSITVQGACTSAGGGLTATTKHYENNERRRQDYDIFLFSDDAGMRVRDVDASTIVFHDDGNISWSWSCVGLKAGTYSTQLRMAGGDGYPFASAPFRVAEAPRAEPPPSESRPEHGPQPTDPKPPAPDAPKPPKPAKPRISNFHVEVYQNEPGRVGVSYDVAWDAGRDPVTCHFFIDNIEKFTRQCGTHSSKQFYDVPAGNRTFHATVSDRYGVFSDPSPKVTKYVPGKPVERSLTIYNKVTNGSTEMREDTPAYLSTVTRNYCKRDGCAIGGTDMNTGATITGLCWVWGDRTTNGEDGNSRDDGNPGLYSSTRWYKARHPGGAVGYISEVWIDPSQRGGAGLPAC